jgi:LysR family transcriptional regulator, benzoate and cis,cis-muconate-responsive activator of ben and cat genes
MTMEFRQLRYFLSLARTLNFTRAAEELHIAQPPLSRQISQLEGELGTLLIDREARPLRLTPAGELFRERASEILARIDRMLQDTRVLGHTGQLTFRIGLEASMLYGRIPVLLRQLRSANPHRRIDLVEMAHDRQIAALKEGQIEIGFGRVRVSDPALVQVLVREEPLFVALPASHTLAAKAPAPLCLEDLADQTFILFPAGTPRHLPSPLQALFKESGFRPKEVIEAGELQVALGLVAADCGVCVVPSLVQRMRGSDVSYRQLDEPGAVSPVIITRVQGEEPDIVRSVSELLSNIPY